MNYTHILPWMLLVSFALDSFGLAVEAPDTSNLVRNSDFEQGVSDTGRPLHWQTSGRVDILQSLSLDAGRTGGSSARLECSQFVGGTPDAHVMMCQLGTVAIKRGQWYRLSFWIRGSELTKPTGSVTVSNTRPWGSSGVDGQFPARKTWRQFEFFCQADNDVPAETSRLQFWFSGTGTMWFDDIVLEPVEMSEKFHPAIATQDVKNLIPNSSFECGSAGWGNYSPNFSTWAGNLNQQFGVVDTITAQHGQQSLRIKLKKATAPVFHWDYYEAIVQPVHTILCANMGWVPVTPGESYVLSCYIKADQADVPALLLVHHAQRGNSVKRVAARGEWTRCDYVFRARSEFLWIGIGLDLEKSPLEAAQLWIDAVQLEAGEGATSYATRATVESTIVTPAVGNIFLKPEEGLAVELVAHNATPTDRSVSGRISVRDFFDKEVLTRDATLAVPAQTSRSMPITGLLPGGLGYYRIVWTPTDHVAPFQQTLRRALLRPYDQPDSPFGMNHAYPWDFMLELCRDAGIMWMRDWSAKWQTVEPQQGVWDFSRVDPQISRVPASELNLLVLLPFASATWCSGADLERIRRDVGNDKYRLDRSIVACPANDTTLFRNYVQQVTKRYGHDTQWIEIMNEPLYTSYSVPAAYGYKLEDYLQVLRNAHQAIKATSPETNVIGGIGTWVESHWVQDFIDAGGLKWCDAMDIHLYPTTVPPESYEAELASTWQKMQARGEARPIWLTEFGCYADDDPYKTPGQIGDSAMSRANWGSERAASEALVKTAAVFLTHGVKKIFYHAGTCGPINSSSGGGIFFEYGGTPRKMYAAQCALAHQLGPDPIPQPMSSRREDLHQYRFETGDGCLSIVWADDEPVTLSLPPSVQALDLMGNRVHDESLTVSATPIYLRASTLEDLSL